MTYFVERDGKQIELTWQECRDIYAAWLNECRMEDIQYLWEDLREEYTAAAAKYVDNNLDEVLNRYSRTLDNRDDWADYARLAFDEVLEDYETETGEEARA